jgi:UDP:flavonoid glycosyltransferase YjiC (YdhE family)
LSWTPAVTQPAWWNELDSDRPTIYVSLGSSGQPRLLRMIVEVAAGLGNQVIVATAARCRIEDMSGPVFVADFLDGGAAAARSALTICNGGSTAGPQALAVGCPVLGVTSNMDQSAFMSLLARTGAGRELGESEVDKSTLMENMLTILRDQSYRQAAERMQTAIKNIDTGTAFEHALRMCIETGSGDGIGLAGLAARAWNANLRTGASPGGPNRDG